MPNRTRILITVNPDTVPYYEAGVRWLESLGVRYVIVSLNGAATWQDADLRALRRVYGRLVKWYLAHRRADGKLYFSPFDKRIAAHVFSGDKSCRLGKRQISVAPDGTLYPCVQFVGHPEYAIGTTEHGIDESARRYLFERNECERVTCAG